MKDYNLIFEKKFEEALLFRDKGDTKKAISSLLELLEENPKSTPVLSMIGSIYFNSEKYDNAIEYFEKAAQLNPSSELISIGLFHSLWNVDRKEEALAEARRFVTNYPSKEYLLLIKEMSDGLKEV